SMNRNWRGKQLNIQVDNSAGVEKGVVRIVVNGKEISGCYVLESELKENNEITVVMG
ncbi:MAG: hypothetical protein H7X79_06630, partial [Sporomusaceae bacterium]|nr:hypothetical protein [Sporomusaceae bacterium]